MAANIIGIDPSSKSIAVTGWQSVTDTLVMRRTDLPGSKYTPARAHEALRMMQGVVEYFPRLKRGTNLAYIEEPVVGRGGVRSSVVQAYINGIIQATLIEAGYDVYLVNVQTWKREVVGHGGADKAKVRTALQSHWPKAARLAGRDQDLIDSAAICFYGQIVWKRSRRVA